MVDDGVFCEAAAVTVGFDAVPAGTSVAVVVAAPWDDDCGGCGGCGCCRDGQCIDVWVGDCEVDTVAAEVAAAAAEVVAAAAIGGTTERRRGTALGPALVAADLTWVVLFGVVDGVDGVAGGCGCGDGDDDRRAATDGQALDNGEAGELEGQRRCAWRGAGRWEMVLVAVVVVGRKWDTDDVVAELMMIRIVYSGWRRKRKQGGLVNRGELRGTQRWRATHVFVVGRLFGIVLRGGRQPLTFLLCADQAQGYRR